MKAKRFISTALALLTALSSITFTPTTVYATNSESGDTLENSAGGATGGSSVTSGGDWGNDVGNSGIRISLVSADDPSQVVSIGTDGYPMVVDIIFGTKAQFDSKMNPTDPRYKREAYIFTSTKAQPLSTDANHYKRIFLTDYLTKLATDASNKEVNQDWYKKLTSEDMANDIGDNTKVKTAVEKLVSDIRWMQNSPNSKGGTNYTLSGTYLRDWLLSNSRGEHVDSIGLSAEQTTTSTVLADGSTKTLTKTTTADKRSNGANSKKDTGKNTQTVTREQTASFLEECLTKANEKYSYMSSSSNFWKTREDCKSWVTSMNACLGGSLDSGKITYSAFLTYQKAVKQINDRNLKCYNTLVQAYNNKQKRLNMVKAVFDKFTGTMTVYGAENTTSASDTAESSAPVTEEEVKTVYEKQLLNHLSYILQLSDENNDPYFITKDMLDEKGNIRKVEDGSRNMTVFDPALEDKTHTEFRILVEPLNWFTPHKNTSPDIPLINKRFYGTLTNIAQAFEKSGVNKLLNDGWAEHLNRNTFNRVSWCAMTVGTDSDILENMFNHKFIFDSVGSELNYSYNNKLYSYKVAGDIVPNRVLADNSYPYDHPTEGRKHQLGWGVQVYWPKPPETVVEAGTTSTWDGTDKPAPSPKTDGKPTPLKVAKWYYTEDNVTNTETVTAVKVQSNSNSPISIKNEDVGKDDLIWEVAGWSTGLSDSIPADNDTTTTYEHYSDSNKGTYAGTEPTILTLEKEDPDKVLYVKLVAKPLSTSVVDIVKVFEKPDDSNPTIAVEKDIPLTEGQEYNPTDSRGNYTENIQSADPSKSITIWDDILDQGLADDGNPIIKERDTKTIYIHYNGDPITPTDPGGGNSAQSTIVLHQDELSYGYTLRDLRRDGTLAYWQESFKSMAGKVRYCSGHEKERSDGSTYTVYCSYRSRTIDDNFYSLRANLPNNNPNFIADIAEQEDGAGIGAWTISGFKGIAGGLTARNYPNASFLLYRNRDKDRVTLYPGKNDASTKSFTK